jgi:hypothetical protein
MYFEDLTPYSYDLPKPLAGVLNVGWLDEHHPFNCSAPPAGFGAALRRWLLHSKANQMRGFHLCRFCRFEGYQQTQVTIEGRKVYLGAAEVWIPSTNGSIFAAPDLILHYVEAHSYLPPPSFIDAVLRPVPADWNATAVSESAIKEVFT